MNASRATPADKRLIRAAEMANQDSEVREIESELDSLTDEIREPWDDGETS